MKKTTLFILLIAAIQLLKAQTVLKPGDIAIVHINKSYESFDFVPLVSITAGTVIEFTDMKYSASLRRFIPFANPQYDGKHTFTASQNYAAGTVIQSKYNLLESKKFITTNTEGNTLIAFQVNNNDTTYLTAIGWYTAINFKPGVSDIPPGLSVAENTVVKFDSTETYYNKYMYYNIKFDPMSDASKMTGTAVQLRRRFADNANYLNSNQLMQNTPVSNFTVLAPDTTMPTLLYSYPKDAKTNVSKYRDGVFEFDEEVIVRKPIILAENGVGNIKTFTPADFTIQNDTVLFYKLFDYLEKNKTYTLSIPAGFVTDYSGNEWPQTSMVYNFAVSSRNTVKFLFGSGFGEIIYVCPDCARTSDISYTTTSRTERDGQHYWSGVINWKKDGIPVRYYLTDEVVVASSNSFPDFPSNAIEMVNISKRFVIDFSRTNQTVTSLWSRVIDNNSMIEQEVYSANQVISNKQFSAKGGMDEGKLLFDNTNDLNIDSVVYRGYESYLKYVEFEVTDQLAPTVELGNTKTICEGDSVLLDAGITLGALYNWSNGDKQHSTWVKTSGNYSVSVSNSLGTATDQVQVIVKPIISLTMPDTIYACVGDTVTLTAGTNTENSYFWSPGGQTTPSIKVTQSGIYHVLVNNGFGGCFTTDSTRVIFKGARAHIGFNQGGMTGYNDVEGQLYKKNTNGKFEMFVAKNLPQFATFDSLPKGEYILKAHFVSYTFVGPNPFIDTYHDGKTEWSKVVPFKLTCETDTMFSFTLANKPTGYEFNGTGVISGKVVVSTPTGVRAFRVKSEIADTNGDILILLYDGSGNLIATTYPDANGNYSFTNLPAGNYSIGVERTGFTVQTLFTTSLPDGGTVSNADFTVNEDTQSIVQGLTTGIGTVSAIGFLQLSVSPNPIKSSAKLRILSEKTDNITISVLDFTGRICKSLNLNIEQGVNVITLNNEGFSGIYLLKISTSTKMIVQRVIFE